MPSTTLYRADALTQFSDVDLVEAVYAGVQQLADDDDSDAFYFLLTEAFERFAPAVEFQVARGRNVDGPEGLEDSIRRMGDRQAMRLSAQAERLTVVDAC